MKTLRDGLYGLALGDALGMPVEFLQRGSYEIKNLEDLKRYSQDLGDFSDDTAMTLATAYSIKEKGEIDLEDIMKNFLLWLNHGFFTSQGRQVGIGGTTQRALWTYENTKSLDQASQKSERSNGNGSLMRILPLIFTDASSADVAQVSALTHGHQISIEGCQIYVYIGRRLLQGEDLKDILKDMTFSESYERLAYLEDLKEEDIKSTGYVVYSLEASLWCLLKTSSFEECILKAINLGDDTDTIGAIAGGLAGIIYGYENIPKSWIDILRAKDLIEGAIS